MSFDPIKTEITEHFLITLVPKRPFVFYSKIGNFTVVPEQPFVKSKILKTVPKWLFIFLKRNTKILKLYPKGIL